MPHATQSLVNILHDLGRRIGPAELKKLLPNVACVAMNHGLRDSAQEFMDHDCLVLLRHRIECLLDDMATKRIHREIKSVSSNGLCNLDDLFRRAVLKAALDKEVSKTVDHERIGLGDYGLDNVVLLLRSSDFKLLLKEYGRLLVVVADYLVYNVLPVTVDVAVKKTTIVEGLSCGEICLPLGSDRLLWWSVEGT